MISMNAEEIFLFIRELAKTQKQSFRHWFFDSVNLVAIRGNEVGVS